MTRLLITGCGRTGTVWLTHALIRAGVPARHEVAFSMTRHGEAYAGEKAWKAEVSWLAAPYTPVANCYVVHVVRNPLDCIRSRMAWGTFRDHGGVGVDRRPKGRWAMEKCAAIKKGKTNLERCALHWVHWNQMIKGADELVHVEDITIDHVGRWANLVYPSIRPAFELPSKSLNGAILTGTPSLVWEDLAPVAGVLPLAKQYGYL